VFFKKCRVFFLFFIIFYLTTSLWSQEIVNVSRSPQWESWGPRIALDTAGNVHVVWLELYSSNSGDVFYSYYDAVTKNWSSPFNVSQSGEVYCYSFWATDIGVDASNRVYVVWVERNRAKLRIKDGVWGSETLVNSGGWPYDSPRIGVSTEGDVHIVWWTDEGIIWGRSRVGGVWEETRAISPGQSRCKFPDITVGRNLVAACWMERGPGEAWYQIVYSQRANTRGASWTTSKIVAPAGSDQQHGAIALDYLDRAHIVCSPEIYTATRQVYYVTGTLAGFERSVPISSLDNIHYPFIVEAGGNLYVCWQLGAWGDGAGVLYNIKRDGNWMGEKSVPGSTGATYSDLAITQDESKLFITWDAGREIFVTSLSLPVTNRPPVADFTLSPQKGEIPLTVTFDASSSYDPDGTIVSYDWDFGDGSTGKGKVVTYTYDKEGTFSVRLIVTDDKGKIGIASKKVEAYHVVYAPLNPSAKITTSGLRKEPTVTYSLSWSPNPKNAEAFVKEYRIYKKEGTGEFKLFATVSKTTTSVQYNFSGNQKIIWGITTFSTLNKESPMAIF